MKKIIIFLCVCTWIVFAGLPGFMILKDSFFLSKKSLPAFSSIKVGEFSYFKGNKAVGAKDPEPLSLEGIFSGILLRDMTKTEQRGKDGKDFFSTESQSEEETRKQIENSFPSLVPLGFTARSKGARALVLRTGQGGSETPSTYVMYPGDSIAGWELQSLDNHYAVFKNGPVIRSLEVVRKVISDSSSLITRKNEKPKTFPGVGQATIPQNSTAEAQPGGGGSDASGNSGIVISAGSVAGVLSDMASGAGKVLQETLGESLISGDILPQNSFQPASGDIPVNP